ncbi:MAG: hypothetical protein IKQ05_01495 [Prevotella sp.]|nr:hypothetical protein [Prevotella sp.]
MKKFFVLVMAVCAISFTSCGNKNAQQAEAAEAESEVVAAEDVVANAAADLAAQLEAGDVSKFQEAVEAVKTKAAELLKENPELAKEYLTKVQDFLKENTEKIKTLAGDNQLVSTAVESLVATPAESIVSNLSAALGNVEDAANAKVEEAQQAAEDQANAAKEAVDQQVDEAKQKAADEVNKGAEKVNEKVNEAADKLLKGTGLK